MTILVIAKTGVRSFIEDPTGYADVNINGTVVNA